VRFPIAVNFFEYRTRLPRVKKQSCSGVIRHHFRHSRKSCQVPKMLFSTVSTILTLLGWATAHQHHARSPHDGLLWDRRVIPRTLEREMVQGSPMRDLDVAVNQLPVAIKKEGLAAPEKTLGGTPSNAVPKHYNLTVEPDMKNVTSFKGDVVMDFDIVEDSNTIFLNAENLTFSDWSVVISFKNGTKAER
jgi:hypothetical protein